MRALGLLPAGRITELVNVIACELLPARVRLSTLYQIGGGTAFEREEVRRGSGSLCLTGADDRQLEGILDGWGLFSDHPDALVREVREMCGEYDAMDRVQ